MPWTAPRSISGRPSPRAAHRESVRAACGLDITREKNRQITFGLGLHFCLGAPLARIEGATALRALAQRFPGITLAVPGHDLEWWNVARLRGLRSCR